MDKKYVNRLYEINSLIYRFWGDENGNNDMYGQLASLKALSLIAEILANTAENVDEQDACEYLDEAVRIFVGGVLVMRAMSTKAAYIRT